MDMSRNAVDDTRQDAKQHEHESQRFIADTNVHGEGICHNVIIMAIWAIEGSIKATAVPQILATTRHQELW